MIHSSAFSTPRVALWSCTFLDQVNIESRPGEHRAPERSGGAGADFRLPDQVIVAAVACDQTIDGGLPDPFGCAGQGDVMQGGNGCFHRPVEIGEGRAGARDVLLRHRRRWSPA
jgi:hypothetical protein